MMLTLFAISMPILADDGGGLGAVIRAPFEFTGDVVEGTGDVITGRNPVKEHEKRKGNTAKKKKSAKKSNTTAKKSAKQYCLKGGNK